MQKITTAQQAGLFFGQVDGKTVCGPYLNKGMAARQAKRIAEASPVEADYITAARAEGKRLGMTDSQVERFIKRMS